MSSPPEEEAARGGCQGCGRCEGNLGVRNLGGGCTSDLADGLQDKVDAVHIGLGDVAAACIDRKPASRCREVVEGHKLVDVVGLAEAMLNDRHQDAAGEVVVELGDIKDRKSTRLNSS